MKEKFVLYQQSQDYVAIKDWNEDERPREKLMTKGSNALTDAELIAVLLGHGLKGISAVDVARNLIHKYGGINDLVSRDYSEYSQIKGVGRVKAVTLAAAFEISKRIEQVPFHLKEQIKSPEDIAAKYIKKLSAERNESFWVVLLNSANLVFREVLISTGILNATLIHPREVFRIAIAENAAAVILLHNHPSGNPQPSSEDVRITLQLVKCGSIIDIKVLDHLVIAGGTYFSMKKSGYI